MFAIRRARYGRGLFAKELIRKKKLIAQYLGLLVPLAEYRKRVDTRYMMEYNRNYVLDGDIPCNKARFINHSIHPNCKAVENNVGIGIYALKDIQRGEEIVMNYGYTLKEIRNDVLFN